MRNLTDVINKMLEVIPIDHGIAPILRDNKSSAAFAAPEMMGHWWSEVADNLQEYLGEPDVEWKRRVQAIFADKEAPDAEATKA